MTAPPIRIAAALILDSAGPALLVRKRGTEAAITSCLGLSTS